jgi:hypothetical protein
MCWIPSKWKSFKVKSYYHVLSTLMGSLFPWNSIWKVKTLWRVALFVWTTTFEKTLTLDNLRKRHVIVVD